MGKPSPTCPSCPISLRTSKKFQFTCPGTSTLYFIDLYKKNIQIMRYIYFFLFLEENICFGYSLEVPLWGISNEYPQHMFSSRNKKNFNFRASKFWLDKWILTIIHGQVVKSYNSTPLSYYFSMLSYWLQRVQLLKTVSLQDKSQYYNVLGIQMISTVTNIL